MKIVQCAECGEVLYCLSPSETNQCNCKNLAYLCGVYYQYYGAVDKSKIRVFDIGRVYITGHDIDLGGRDPVLRWIRKHKVTVLVIQGWATHDLKYMLQYDKTHPEYVRRINFVEYKKIDRGQIGRKVLFI
jgi:hypothetical protein